MLERKHNAPHQSNQVASRRRCAPHRRRRCGALADRVHATRDQSAGAIWRTIDCSPTEQMRLETRWRVMQKRRSPYSANGATWPQRDCSRHQKRRRPRGDAQPCGVGEIRQPQLGGRMLLTRDNLSLGTEQGLPAAHLPLQSCLLCQVCRPTTESASAGMVRARPFWPTNRISAQTLPGWQAWSDCSQPVQLIIPAMWHEKMGAHHEAPSFWEDGRRDWFGICGSSVARPRR